MGPALLVIIAALLFVVPNIHGGYSQLLGNLGIDPNVPVPRLPKNAGKDACSNQTLEKRLPQDLKGVLEAIGCNETAQQMLETAWKKKDWSFALNKIAVPFAKVYFEQLAADFWIITKNALLLFGTLALCSLLPGLAGLIYRRNFWAWFLISFAVLYTINASGFLGVVRQTQPMPFSGEILFFLVFNLALLFVANRVRGYSSSVSAVPPWLYNSLLAAVLILVGVACFEGWGPSWIWSFLGSWIYKWEFLLIGLPVLYILFRTSNRWNDPAPKNIVVCLDGTSNTPDDSDLGLLAQTNVFKLFRMLKADGDKSFVPRALVQALCQPPDRLLLYRCRQQVRQRSNSSDAGNGRRCRRHRHRRAGLSRRHARVPTQRPHLHFRFQPRRRRRAPACPRHRQQGCAEKVVDAAPSRPSLAGMEI